MIVYRHPTAVVPPDLATWVQRDASPCAVCHQRGGDFQHVAICDPILWTIPTDAAWTDIEDGWQVAWSDAGSVVPLRDLGRLSAWCGILPVEDARGRTWLAPSVLNRAGDRAFPVAYAGPNFLPSLTPEQTCAEQIAQEARRTLLAVGKGEAAGVTLQASCRWSALLLAITHHISPAVVAACGILDDCLISRLLAVAAGLDERLPSRG